MSKRLLWLIVVALALAVGVFLWGYASLEQRVVRVVRAAIRSERCAVEDIAVRQVESSADLAASVLIRCDEVTDYESAAAVLVNVVEQLNTSVAGWPISSLSIAVAGPEGGPYVALLLSAESLESLGKSHPEGYREVLDLAEGYALGDPVSVEWQVDGPLSPRRGDIGLVDWLANETPAGTTLDDSTQPVEIAGGIGTIACPRGWRQRIAEELPGPADVTRAPGPSAQQVILLQSADRHDSVMVASYREDSRWSSFVSDAALRGVAVDLSGTVFEAGDAVAYQAPMNGSVFVFLPDALESAGTVFVFTSDPGDGSPKDLLSEYVDLVDLQLKASE